jgi:cytochrome c
MDSFEINKFVACILVIALIFIGLSELGEILYEVEKPEVAHYQVEGLEDSQTMVSETACEESIALEVEESIVSSFQAIIHTPLNSLYKVHNN